MKLAFDTNPVLGGWTPKDSDGWAGGEECIIGFTRAFAARGHEVHVFYDGIATTDGPVLYHPRQDGREMAGGFDAAIHFKCPEQAGQRLAKRLYFWTDQERPFDPDPFRQIAVCSEYLARHLASATPRCAARLTVVPYAIDLDELTEAGAGIARDTQRVLHASSPDRGLEPFLECWLKVLEQRPDAKLAITYGWEFFQKYGGDPRVKERCEKLLEQLPKDSWQMGRVSRLDAHRLFWRCGIWAYFCTGGEQFCLNALKAQWAGAVPVVKPWGALHETVFSGWRADTKDEFVTYLTDALGDEQETLRRRIDRERVTDWSTIAARWEALIESDEDRPRVFETPVRVIPAPPPFAATPADFVAQAVQPIVAEWMNAVRPQAPWVDPTLGFPPGAPVTPDTGDAALIGWSLEDGQTSAGDYLRGLGLRTGTAVMLFVSHGTWRAGLRKRALSRRDLDDILGGLPELNIRHIALNQDFDGITIATFRYVDGRIRPGRDLGRVLRSQAPRELHSTCLMVRDNESTIGIPLKSVESLTDEVCIIDTGVTDRTLDIVDDWHRRTGIPVRVEKGTSPRWCFTCLREHDIGEMGFGHKVAGFETPRNESIALASGDWIQWLDSDEELLNAQGLEKYLRPNVYMGYGIQQHHHSCHPPEAAKVDFPVRLFRRLPCPENQPAGWFDYGPLNWPTYHSGQKARFTGIVHEHPGYGPGYLEGLGPVIVLPDIFIAHRGYFTEDQRRRRFVRNWPLMVADRQKYPDRRLGRFLWIRDLSHQVRYLIESNGSRLTPEAAHLAEQACALFKEDFTTRADAYSADVLMFARTCMEVLGRGIEFDVTVRARKPEVSGEEVTAFQFAGRFDDAKDVLRAIEARLAETNRWCGDYL